MAIYSASGQHNQLMGLGAPELFEVRTSPCNNTNILSLEMWVLNAAAAGTGILLYRTTTAGLSVGTLPFIADDPDSPASLTTLNVMFRSQSPSDLPVNAAQALRRVTFGAGGCILTFPRGLKIPASAGILIAGNSYLAANVNLSVIIDE